MRNLTISFIIFFSLGYAISFLFPDADVRIPNTDIANDAINGGAYIEVVYIGASHCTPSNNSETHSNVKRIKNKIEQIFETSDSTSVIFRGIAIDNVANQGVSFLEKTGPYDEISSGLGVYNSSLDRYVWGNDSILPETPQIIINKAYYKISSKDEGYIDEVARQDSLITKAIGFEEIERLSENLDSEIISN